MAKVEIDMTKIKEELQKHGVKLSELEPEKLKLNRAQLLRLEGKSMFVLVLEDKNRKLYQCRVTTDPIYEDSIKKSLSRLKSVPIPPDTPESPKQEEKKDE